MEAETSMATHLVFEANWNRSWRRHACRRSVHSEGLTKAPAAGKTVTVQVQVQPDENGVLQAALVKQASDPVAVRDDGGEFQRRQLADGSLDNRLRGRRYTH